MRLRRTWMAAAVLLVSCGPFGGGGSDPATVESWLEVLDEELGALGGAIEWSEGAPIDAVAICGPVDEVEGWRLHATVELLGAGERWAYHPRVELPFYCG